MSSANVADNSAVQEILQQNVQTAANTATANAAADEKSTTASNDELIACNNVNVQNQQQQQSQSDASDYYSGNGNLPTVYHQQQQQLQQIQEQQQQQQQQVQSNGSLTGLGLSLMQSSPPPHSYRHSRAYRHFKNPPQPHMCIRTTTEAGEELFINVLSWTRIVIPQEPSDPIPLYGGMRVPPGSPRSPPIVFAVMANPEVLKDSGRHSKDPEERRAMVELMCDFVEAMNPGVKLVRNAIILKDRDISGELKDVWNAVQAQRDREREEQLLQQRQQQHYQNITTQQMFPKTPEAVRAATANAVGANPEAELMNGMTTANNTTLAIFAQQLDNKVANEVPRNDAPTECNTATDINVTNSKHETDADQTDASAVNKTTANANASSKHDNQETTTANNNKSTTPTMQNHVSNIQNTSTTVVTAQTAPATPTTAAPPISNTNSTTNANATTPAPNNANNSTIITTVTPPTAPVTPVVPPKKEKLGGFLPNGCIFPRFKNNKNKDKDNHTKESKSKEKTLLNALTKKSKDKKVAPIEQQQQQQQHSNNDKQMTTTTTMTSTNDATQYEKNCINNLESEVQKMDLNKIETSASNDNMFIKLKVSNNTTAAAVAK